MAASRRYYPGFFAALLLILLRLAIGWHFLYEGISKIYSTPEGRNSFLSRVLPPPPPAPPMEKAEAPFSAEVYLRNASGPLAPYFRQLVPDIDSQSKLRFDRLQATWRAEMDRIAAHYRFNDEQRKEAEQALADRSAIAEDWFRDLEHRQKIDKYYADLAHFLAVERDPRALASERAAAYKDRTQIDADRRELVATVDAWTGALRDAWMKIPTPEQAKQAGPLTTPWTRMEWVNVLTMVGLTAVGLCLMLGLFTRLAALGGALYLLMFYLSMPPWPGLPASPMAEGHYLFVNKNLVELIACLALASLPTGRWIGLDALLFGWLGRSRRADLDERQPAAAAGPAGQHHPGTLTRSDR